MDRILTGNAELICDGESRGQIAYRLEAHRNARGLRMGVGAISGQAGDILAAAYATRVEIRLPGQPTMKIHVDSASPGETSVSVMAPGTIFDA